MNRRYTSPSTVSIFCWSSDVPSVTVTSACVSPRVNTDEPWTRGSTPTSDQIGRISSNLRPSSRTRFSRISSRRTFSLSSLKIALASTLRCTSPSGIDPTRSREHLIDRAVVLELVAGCAWRRRAESSPSLPLRGRRRRRIPSSRRCASPCRLPSRARRSSRRCA